MQGLESMVRFFQEGGAFMLPIALVLALGVAIALERFVFLRRAAKQNQQAFTRIETLLAQQQFDAIMALVTPTAAPITRVIAAGIARLTLSPRRDDVAYAMEEGLMETLPRFAKRTPYLATLANIATLLGLLGTIIGLIAAFAAVANADPAEKASLLAESISVAMNTTAFGLIAAIPLLGCHALLQSKTTDLIESMEMAGVKCLNLLMASQSLTIRSRRGDE